MGRRGSYREGLGFGALSFATLAFVGFFSSVVIARLFGAEVLGEYALVAAPVGVLSTLAALQLQAALVKEISVLPPKAPRVTALFAAVWVFTLLLTLVISPLVLLGAWLLLTGPVGRPELLAASATLMGFNLFVHNTAWTIESVLSSFRAGKALYWIRTWRAISFFAFALIAGLTFDSLWGLVFAEIASRFVSLLQALWAAKAFMPARVSRHDLREGFRALPEMIRFGLKVAPGSLADSITSQTHTWMLGSLAPLAALGAFRRAQNIGARLRQGSNRVYEMLFPTLVERRAKGDAEGFDRVLADTLRYVAIAMLYPAAVGGGASIAVMEIFGPDFTGAAGALTLLLLVPPLYAMANMLGGVLIAVDRPLITTGLQFLRMGVAVGTGVPLIIAFGTSGAALSLLLAYSSDFLWRWRLASRYLQQPIRKLWRPRQMLSLALAYGAGFGVARFVDGVVEGFPLGLLAAGTAGTFAYFITFALTGGVTSRDRKRLADMSGGVTRRLRQSKPAPTAGA